MSGPAAARPDDSDAPPVPAEGLQAGLKAELLSLTPDPGDEMYAACADFLCTPADAGDAGSIVVSWLRAAKRSAVSCTRGADTGTRS